MILCNANIILNSTFKDQPGHSIAFSCVHSLRSGKADYLWHPLIATDLLRICRSLPLKGAGISTTQALEILNIFHFNQNERLAYDSEAQRQTFRRLVVNLRGSGNDATNAFVAAIALQHKATLATIDRGFARFPGLHWIDLNEGGNVLENPG